MNAPVAASVVAPAAIPTHPAPVRTRFAPSPTGFIHLGNIRSALYPWAFARNQNGVFILRIEDTDEERSSQAAVDVIVQSMAWLGMQPDEGPFYQMQRMARYKEVLLAMLQAGTAYYCYTSQEELNALRDAQTARGEKPRYDGRWRPEVGKILTPIPAGVQPVVRFKNPENGSVVWHDAVKGRIEISNAELDDLVIARPAVLPETIGTPTYNFCVVVDDLDMRITHVIRGDDHVNNTPRQINILQALGANTPVYAHLPTILNPEGEKLSKRHGAASVLHYRDEGYLPEAIINYLARLGWSHGDDEIFTREQFVTWFNLDHLGSSPAQFNPEKLDWLNAHYLKAMSGEALAQAVLPFLKQQLPEFNFVEVDMNQLAAQADLYKDRCNTLKTLAQELSVFCAAPHVPSELLAQHLTPAARIALQNFGQKIAAFSPDQWQRETIAQALKATLTEHNLKMPQLAMPLRVLLLGKAQSPSVDAVLALMGQERVMEVLLSKDHF